ncbi:TPA: SPOR domain-containing protein [Candidatus Poribacteria bacterium]|nr:SPOR domain-containing protein [Candidatus Poribacteria bacterium]
MVEEQADEKNTKEPTANNDANIGDNENKTESKAPIKEKQNLNIQQKEELLPNEKKLDDLKQQNNTNSKKTKRGVGFWMLLSLIILIVAGGTYIVINYDDIKQHIPFLADNPQSTDHEGPEKMKEIIGENNNTESSTDQIVASESIKVNDTNIEGNEDAGEGLVEEQADEKNTKEEVTSDIPPSNENSFHVIAGAFSSESNAKLLGNKLRAKGYDVKVGRGRGMNLVSIKSFATRTEANQALADFKEVAPNCWVYEWK